MYYNFKKMFVVLDNVWLSKLDKVPRAEGDGFNPESPANGNTFLLGQTESFRTNRLRIVDLWKVLI